MATGNPTSFVSCRDDLLQKLRTWVKAAASLTDAQMIVQESDMPRPTIPYLSIELIVFDAAVGTDERVSGVDGSGDPVVSVRGQRRATASIRAFGDQASDWLSEAKASLHRDSIREILEDEGVSIALLGSGQQDTAINLAGAWESRSTQDIDIAYTFESVEESAIELLTYEHTGTGESPVAPDFVLISTINV